MEGNKVIQPNADNDFMFRRLITSDEKKRYAELQGQPGNDLLTEGGNKTEKLEYFTD